MCQNTKSGFTLIEIIIVIGLIALLAVFTIVAIDPARRIGEARNSLRATDAKNIKKALESFAADNVSNGNILPSSITGLSDNTNYMIAAAGDNTGGTVSCTAVGNITKVDVTNGVSTLFNYLATIPVDPEQTAPYTNGSGYYFKKQGNKIIDVKPCNVYTYAVATTPSACTISSVSFDGTEYTYSTGAGYWTRPLKIDASTIIATYDTGTKVGTVSGTSLSFGSDMEQNDNIAANYNTLTAFSNTKIGVAYDDTGFADYGRIAIGDVSGNSITFTDDQSFTGTPYVTYPSIVALDSTHFVTAYDASGAQGLAMAGTISGRTVTYGTASQFDTGNVYYTALAKLDSTHFVLAYRDISDTNKGKVIVGSISGTTISWDTSATTFNAGGRTDYIDIVALDSTNFVIVYNDNANSNKGTAIVGSVSAGTISLGAETVFENAIAYNTFIDAVNSGSVIITWADSTNTLAEAVSATVNTSARTISFGTPVTFNNAITNLNPDIAVLSDSQFVVTYSDSGNGAKATAQVGTIHCQ